MQLLIYDRVRTSRIIPGYVQTSRALFLVDSGNIGFSSVFASQALIFPAGRTPRRVYRMTRNLAQILAHININLKTAVNRQPMFPRGGPEELA